MTAIAQAPVQCLKRTASVVLFLPALLGCWTAAAQQAIYRCGHAYTNMPRDLQACERLIPQAITVITGTRPAPAPPAKSAVALNSTGHVAQTAAAGQALMSEADSATRAQQAARDEQARDVLTQALVKAQAQRAQLQQIFNQGEPDKWASESRNHQKYLDRVASLQAAMAQSERDIDSLQRELTRRPVLVQPRTP